MKESEGEIEKLKQSYEQRLKQSEIENSKKMAKLKEEQDRRSSVQTRSLLDVVFMDLETPRLRPCASTVQGYRTTGTHERGEDFRDPERRGD